MAKLTRESRLRERRLDKQARKDARKLAPAHDPYSPGDVPGAATGERELAASAPAGLEPAPAGLESAPAGLVPAVPAGTQIDQ